MNCIFCDSPTHPIEVPGGVQLQCKYCGFRGPIMVNRREAERAVEVASQKPSSKLSYPIITGGVVS